jgi:predicted XRE-type DNA-binding protein
MAHEMVNSTGRQVEDGRKISHTMESVSEMVIEMFDNMEQRRLQSSEVIMELESLKSRAS